MRRFLPLGTLILVALLAAIPLWGPGMVNTRGGGDSPFLLQRTHQLVANLRAGVFPVRWMPDAAYGLGYPFFSYYAALPYYLAGGAVLLGLDILTALKLVQTVGFVAAALAMFGWMRRMTGNRWAAWLAGVAYTVTPFHLVNVYVRGDSLSEFYAFAFYPLVLWGLSAVAESVGRQAGGRANLPIVATALAYAGLLLTHNLSALIFTPFAILYLAALAWRAKRSGWRVLALGVSSCGLGILLAAWFLFPAGMELEAVQLGPSVGSSPQDYFHYSNHFRTLNLIQPGLLFDYSVAPDLGDRSPFAMGLVQAICGVWGVLALLACWIRRRLDGRWGFVLAGLAISTVMITPLSRPLWDHLPLLRVVQFPWRFLSVQALCTAAVTGRLVDGGLQGQERRARNWAVGTGWLAAALLALSTILPLRPERLLIGPSDVSTGRLQLYELFSGNIGTTIRYEWLPNTANPRPFTSDLLVEPDVPLHPIPLDGAALEADLVERTPTHQTWQVWGEGGTIAFPILYWPGWSAAVDGAPADAWPVEGSGVLALNLPTGEHTVALWLDRTPVRAAAEMISLAAAAGLLIIALAGAARRPDSRPAGHRPSAVVICALVMISGSLLILLLLPGGDLGSDADLTMDFDRSPYLHHNPGGVDMGAARLGGYAFSSDTPSPGGTLTITLDWIQASSPFTATVRLVSPAAVRYEVEPLAEADLDLETARSWPISLHLPEDTPRGLYLVQLESGGVRVYLRPVRVADGPALPADAPVLASFGPAIRLHAVSAVQADARRLAVKLAWSTAHRLAANYGLSIRLVDGAGQPRVSLDTQPGYGFLPTSIWRPGELVTDQVVLTLPDDVPPGEGYSLHILVYQVSTLVPLGQARLENLTLPLALPFEAQPTVRLFTLPPLANPLEVRFGEEIELAGYESEQAETLRLTLWWRALQAPAGDYTVFVHLFDPLTEEIVVQSDAMPRGGTYPTSWWAAGEVVSDTVTLPLAQAPAGTYRLAVGLTDRAATRLPAVEVAGQPVPGDRLVLPVEVEIDR